MTSADSSDVAVGKTIEVRGFVKDQANVVVVGKDYSVYDVEPDMSTYEQMLDYYHGMCRHLTIV